MTREKEQFKRGEFLRNVMTLLPGTLLSQAIPIVFSIVLARIYSPGLFGIYFLFTSILSLAIIFSTGKYELAILMPENDDEAGQIIGTALTTCLSFCAALFLLFLVLDHWILSFFKTPHFGIWLLILPLSVFFSAANEVFYYWHNRKRRYSILSWSKIIQTLTSSSLQLILGFLFFGVTGLIVGLIFGQALSFAFLAWHYYRKDSQMVRFQLFKNYFFLARKYRNFPADIAVASFVNEAANQVPNIFMTRYLGQTVVGHYGYAQRTIRTPLGVIANAFSDVYKSRAAEHLNTYGTCRPVFTGTLKNLFLLAVIPFTVFYFIAPQAFAIIFGEAFRTSGEYARMLTIPFFLNFITMPVSSTFYLINKTKLFLLIQTTGLILVIASILLGYYFYRDSYMIILFLSVSFSITNLFMLAALFLLVNRKKDENVDLP